MRKWTFWDWFGYSCIWVAALAAAADGAIRNSPGSLKAMPHFFTGPLWSFIPLIFVALGTAVLVAQGFGLIGNQSKGPQGAEIPKPASTTSAAAEKEWSPFPPNWNDPLKYILRQHYRNESVELDGNDFVECTFVDVKFTYEGIRPTQMTNCQFGIAGLKNPVIINTKNPAILNVFLLLRALNMFKDESNYDIHTSETR